MPKQLNLVGQVFKYLTAIELVDPIRRANGTTAGAHKCKCICGETVVVMSSRLKLGTTSSCGCKATEMRSKSKIELYKRRREALGIEPKKSRPKKETADFSGLVNAWR